MPVTVLNTTASLTGKTLAKLEDSQSFTGAKTWDRGASAPFICISGSAMVQYLDADKLDGQEGVYYSAPFSWTPALTFATPGDLSVIYSTQTGIGHRNGRLTTLWATLITSTFTHATASGNLIITGNPDVADGSLAPVGNCSFQGITKANYTQYTPSVAAGASNIQVQASGSAQGLDIIDTGDMPSGGTVALIIMLAFRTS